MDSCRQDSSEQVVLLCERPASFLAAFVAVIASGLPVLLPPSRKPAAVKLLLKQYPHTMLIHDGDQSQDGLVDLVGSASIQISSVPTDCSGAAIESDIPQIPAEQLAAILFTSGSTGAPKENRKLWQELVAVSALMRKRLQLDSQDCLLVAVPPQHMYGFETQVLLPLLGGIKLYAERLFYPADIHVAMIELRGKGIQASLVITPIQLRAMLGSGLDFSGLRQIICSAAPLSVTAAKQAEDRWNIPVVEIFGSTELGSIASRKTATEDSWKLYPGVSLQQQEKGWQVNSNYLPNKPVLDDLIELDKLKPDCFSLLGRADDLVKVGGKRASLMALNKQILEIPGVIDGVFFMPDETLENPRLSALVVAPELSRSVLLDHLGAQLEAVFLPRPLYFVDNLPRGRNGKLPHAEVQMLLEKLQKKPVTRIEAYCKVPINHPSLKGHFPGRPVIPGVVLLELLQVCFEKHFPQQWISQLPRVKFTRQLVPGENCQVLITIDSQQGNFKLLNEAGELLVSGQFKYCDVIPADSEKADL